MALQITCIAERSLANPTYLIDFYWDLPDIGRDIALFA